MPKLDSPIHPTARGSTVVLGQDPEGAARVRRMLSDLWSEMRATDGDSPSFHRVCLTNLIVAGPRTKQQALESFAATFASSHPSRVILALVDPGASQMKADISASCQRSPSGGDVVCWEKIVLTVPASCDASLASVVRALLMGRVATVAVLALPAADWPMLIAGVRAWGDLLVSDLGCSLARNLLFWDRNGDRCGHPRWIARLWEGLKPARLSLARDYETEDSRRAITEADEIQCAGPNTGVCRLILGWIISRLGWVITGKAPDGNGVLVRRPSGELALIEATTGGQLALRCYQSGSLRYETLFGSPPIADGKFAWDDPQWPATVIQAMHTVRPDHVFFTAADAASQLEHVQFGKRHGLRLTVARDTAALADEAAVRFAELADTAIRARGRFLVALAGGSTPEALYRRLAASPHKEAVAWDKIEWFWGDERWVAHDDPQSNCGMAKRALLDHVPVLPQKVHPFPTGLASPTEAAEEYEATIRNVAGVAGVGMPVFDLVLLGLGTDGHTASWFPDTPLDWSVQSLTWGGFVPAADAPRVTITPRLIRAARCALFLVSGKAKAGVVARTLYPPWEGRHPAARIELSDGHVEWFVDADAASQIEPAQFS